MNVATLRISGSDEALDELKSALKFEPETRWKKGEPSRGGLRGSSGYSLTIADSESRDEMWETARAFLLKCQQRGIVMGTTRWTTELVVGIGVGDSEQFVGKLRLTSADLQLIADLGITLDVVACPVSDAAGTTTDDRIERGYPRQRRRVSKWLTRVGLCLLAPYLVIMFVCGLMGWMPSENSLKTLVLFFWLGGLTALVGQWKSDPAPPIRDRPKRGQPT